MRPLQRSRGTRRAAWEDRGVRDRSAVAPRFEAAFRSAPWGMGLVAPDGGWIEVNPALCALLGYVPAEMHDLTVADIVHPDDALLALEGERQVLEGEVRAYQGEKRLVHRDGRTVWALVGLSLMEDESGPPCFVFQAQDITERRALEEELTYRATHDGLTGLPSRRLLLDRLDSALGSGGHSGSVALLYIDLDGFKAVNDSFGHEAGDELLVAAVGRIMAGARATDTVARLGGDEFCVLLEGLETAPEPARVVRRISERLEAPFALASGIARLSASIGVAVAGPGDGHTAGGLLREADAAMYRVKGMKRAVPRP